MRTAQTPEWVLISSHLFAHHAQFAHVPKSVPKLVYAHTPARYIWAPELDERGNSVGARMVSPLLKYLDKARIKEATSIAANSQFVADRILRTWEREAHVIYPPVDVSRIQSRSCWRSSLSSADREMFDDLPKDFVLGASRFVPYKRMDQVIEVGVALNLPVVLVGGGPEEAILRQKATDASVPVHFVGRASDPLLYALFQQARLFVFPPVEDFGIVPVEAMAAGAPVLANSLGGASESVLDGITGALTNFDNLADVKQAAERAMACDTFSIRERAREFSEETFAMKMAAWVDTYSSPGARHFANK